MRIMPYYSTEPTRFAHLKPARLSNTSHIGQVPMTFFGGSDSELSVRNAQNLNDPICSQNQTRLRLPTSGRKPPARHRR